MPIVEKETNRRFQFPFGVQLNNGEPYSELIVW